MTTAAERNSESEWLPPWTRLEHEARYEFAAQFVAGKNVVDCACGAGIGSILFAASGASEVCAIDASLEAVAEAEKANTRSNLKITLADAIHTGLPDNYADVFISLETIEHLKQDEAFVEEIFRVLKPGGVLICSTPNRDITNPGTIISDAPWNPHHIREYNFEEFKALLESRLETVAIHGQNPISKRRVIFMQRLAEKIGKEWAIKINKFLKCRWFVFSAPKHHAVQPISDNYGYEFYILVSRKSERS